MLGLQTEQNQVTHSNKSLLTGLKQLMMSTLSFDKSILISNVDKKVYYSLIFFSFNSLDLLVSHCGNFE